MADIVDIQRHIVRRPRLTNLLDKSPARLKLLVAPAGYGKTTLAQQWLESPERRDVWYRGGPASADVAALAAGLSKTLETLIPGAGKRMRERIRAVGHPEDDVDLLAELFAEDLDLWPDDAWLAIDDYHFAMASSASDRFVDLLARQTGIQILLTSRSQPGWATARRVLYGEVQVIDQRTLSMTDQEARATLRWKGDSVSALLKRAAGWPAVIGLASLREPSSSAVDHLPAALYDYFAEEILNKTNVSTQNGLAILALARSFDANLAHALIGGQSSQTVREGVRLGVVARDEGGVYRVHPLLGEFLEMQLRADRSAIGEMASVVGRCLLSAARPDDAFELAARFGDTELIEEVVARSFDRLLSEGRMATIGRWLEHHPFASSNSPIVYLAEAETAYRQGQHSRARELAEQATVRLDPNSPLMSRALTRAGQSALLASCEADGLGFFETARETAHTPGEVREALIGLYFAASELGLPAASAYLEELGSLADGSPETTLRIEAARLTHATRTGAIADAVERALAVRHLVSGAADPLASTGFLHMLTNALNLAGRYDEATESVASLIETARRYRLAMPVPHALLNQALARHGRRQYAGCHASLNAVSRYVGSGGDTYLEFSVQAIRARVLASEGRLEDAQQEALRPSDTISSPPLRAEYLASQSMVYALSGQSEYAAALAHAAHIAFPSSVEARVLTACTSAINAQGDADRFRQRAREAWRTADNTGNFDSLVCAYRAHPPLLVALFETLGSEVHGLVGRARDVPLARRLGIRIRTAAVSADDLLTPRETEVFELLRSGLTNRAIAQALVVSEATVKVHLRHIYEKFGVRTRAEAVARSLTQ